MYNNDFGADADVGEGEGEAGWCCYKIVDHVIDTGLIDAKYLSYLHGIRSGLLAVEDIQDERYRTYEMYYEAVCAGSCHLLNVPPQYLTFSICFKALSIGKRFLNTIRYVPEEYLIDSPELCLAAIECNPFAMQYVPEIQKTPEFYKRAIRANPSVLKWIDPSKITYSMAKLAASLEGATLQDVPMKFRTQLVCELAVENDPGAMEHVVAVSLSLAEKVYRRTIQPSSIAFKDIPLATRRKSSGLCFVAVLVDGLNLEFVPEHWKSLHLCAAAVRQNIEAKQFIEQSAQHICVAMSKLSMDATDEKDADHEIIYWEDASDVSDE